jgi:hypothetical protein
MPQELKPLSDAMRKALAMLGETPDEHQAQSQAIQRKRDHRLPPAPKLTPASQLVSHWHEDKWLPDARVMFLRRTHCQSCGSEFDSPHWPETFIRQRYKGKPDTYRYTPSRSSTVSHIELPRLIIPLETTAHLCHLCPGWQLSITPLEQPQCLSDFILSRLGNTASSAYQADPISSTSSDASCELMDTNPANPFSLDTAPDSSTTSPPTCTPPTDGSESTSLPPCNSERSATEQPAGATHTSSLTTRVMASVLNAVGELISLPALSASESSVVTPTNTRS